MQDRSEVYASKPRVRTLTWNQSPVIKFEFAYGGLPFNFLTGFHHGKQRQEIHDVARDIVEYAVERKDRMLKNSKSCRDKYWENIG